MWGTKCKYCPLSTWLKKEEFDPDCQEWVGVRTCERGHETLVRVSKKAREEQRAQEEYESRMARLKRFLGRFEKDEPEESSVDDRKEVEEDGEP